MKTPLDTLSPEGKAKLAALGEDIQYDKITTSFTLEGHGPDGSRRVASVSLSASRRGGPGFSKADMKLVRLMVGRAAVAATYDEAVRRGVLTQTQANEQATATILKYDEALAAEVSKCP